MRLPKGLEVTHLICERCGEVITFEDLPRAVFRNEFDEDAGGWIGRGPFHGECAKAPAIPELSPETKTAT